MGCPTLKRSNIIEVDFRFRSIDTDAKKPQYYRDSEAPAIKEIKLDADIKADPESQRRVIEDPAGYVDGLNLYNAYFDVNGVDPTGLAIYAFDGTNNDKDNPEKGRATNVAILFDLHGNDSGPKENNFYINGVGTGDRVDYALGGFSGSGGRRRLEAAYSRLVENFKKGDTKIDIVGFSRGAALAREFANMVAERGDPSQYVREKRNSRAKVIQKGNMGGNAPSIRFLGVFDTVGSFGLPGNSVDMGFNFSIPSNVQTVRHAVAKDEFRGLFPLTSIHSSPNSQNTNRLKEKVFSGVHSDIGGGYDNNMASLDPFIWMYMEAKKVGVPLGDVDISKYFFGKKHYHQSWTFGTYFAHHIFGYGGRNIYYPK